MAVARPYGFEVDFVWKPISWSAASFFVIILKFIFTPIFKSKFSKKILGTKKICFQSHIFADDFNVHRWDAASDLYTWRCKGLNLSYQIESWVKINIHARVGDDFLYFWLYSCLRLRDNGWPQHTQRLSLYKHPSENFNSRLEYQLTCFNSHAGGVRYCLRWRNGRFAVYENRTLKMTFFGVKEFFRMNFYLKNGCTCISGW